MALESGTRLSHYEITNQIGKGGMGEVYRARDTKLGREVAIKVLPAEFARDEERIARLEREARMLAALNHPNIATIYGLEESDDTRFLVLELVEGDTLGDRIKRGPMPVEESLHLAVQIVDALKTAHDSGVIHRDLKPDNVKVSDEGTVKVLDFGLAKTFDGREADVNLSDSPTLSIAATQAGVILGTAAYMSPEQAKAQAVDRRVDIWAFGCVFYEMLTGRQAFGATDVAEVLAAVIRADPDWRLLPDALHPRLREILERCLQKDLTRRFQDAGDLRNDLQALLAGPIGAGIQTTSNGTVSPALAKLAWTAAALFGGIAVVLGVLMLQPEDSSPIIRFTDTLGPEGFSRPGSRALDISRDGTQWAWVEDGQIWLRRLDTPDARAITGTDENVTTPFFSPDGTFLGFWSGTDAELKRVAVTGGVAVPLVAAANPFGARWEPDGTILYSQPDGIWRVAETGGTPEQIVEAPPGEEVWGPQMLPDGAHVLYTVRPAGNADIVVEDLASGDRTIVRAGGRDGRYLPTGHLLYASDGTLFALRFDPDTLVVDGGPTPVVSGVSMTAGVRPVQYAVSDNGTLVYVSPPETTATVTGVLALVDTDGTPHRLEVPSARYRSPRVSPDGDRVAVEIVDDDGVSAIWLLDLAGEAEPLRLTAERTGNNSRPVWTSDGEYIAFASDREGAQGIWWKRADGTEEAQRLTQAEEGLIHHPESWSPDNVLMFSLVGPSDWGLWTYDLASDETREFYNVPTNQFGAAFSPDGRWLALTDTRPGIPADQPFVILVQRFPDGPRQELQAGSWPVWSPDTDSPALFYRRNSLNSPVAQLWRMDIELEPAIRISGVDAVPAGDFLTIATYRNFDVAPDGRLLIVVPDQTPESLAPESINVVLNWFQELRERVPVD